MATPSEKLADSLDVLNVLQEQGLTAIRSRDLSRTHRERLCKNGFLQKVIKGWCVPSRPDGIAGESTDWYASYWSFCAAYLQHRFDSDWCLSPEQSLCLYAGNWTVPAQLLVRSPRAHNNMTVLPHDTSLFDARLSIPDGQSIIVKDGLRLLSLPMALITCAAENFRQNSVDMRAALSMIGDASELLAPLLEGGHSTIAGRMAGALRNIGRGQIADNILSTMRAAGYDVREDDPFEEKSPLILSAREQSPYVNRMGLMWQNMRAQIIERFPISPGLPQHSGEYLKRVQDIYVTDAYHSLSIEGYRVSPELITQVRSGDWDQENRERDQKHRDALAARGYWQAYQSVQKSLNNILQGDNPGETINNAHRDWYQQLFAPSVTAGLISLADLAGYRNGPVYIRYSKHVPPRCEAVRDMMPAFVDLLAKEEEASVRVVLGHFIFVYIHPYMDGNGRMGRFLMNAMLASGGYPWTVIPVEQRDTYMAALETASATHDIGPFTDFIARLVEAGLNGNPVSQLPG